VDSTVLDFFNFLIFCVSLIYLFILEIVNQMNQSLFLIIIIFLNENSEQ
jgi:hypothetical protein